MNNWRKEFEVKLPEFYHKIKNREDYVLEVEKIKDFIAKVEKEASVKGLENILKHFEKVMKNHCCKYECNCEKDHLYCGYELDHGIELGSVIEDIRNEIIRTKEVNSK